MEEILNEIKNKQDLSYAEFNKRIIPNQENRLVMLRIPQAKNIAKKYVNTCAGESFLNALPHASIDENNVHGLMLGYLKNDINFVLQKLEEFLPYMDNWATCDITCMNLKIFKKHQSVVKEKVKKWIKSDKTFIQRFGIVTLLTYFLDNNFCEEDFELLNISKDDYYVNMALAWYFSVALVKQYDCTIKIFEQKLIKNSWVHNKAIQKAIESFRLSDDKKTFLKTLKIQ